MKLIVKNYSITNKKILRKLKICLVSDFHFSNKIMDIKLDLLYDNLKKTKPDYICIAGDYVDCANFLEDKTIYNKSINYLKKLANITKVIFTLGNHDTSKIISNKKREYYINEKWINDIKSINNLIYIHNDVCEENNIRFIVYNPPHKYYKKFNEDQELLIKDINRVIPNVNNNKYNILICHSPIHIFKNNSIYNINIMKNIDMVLSGHMHNALTPNFVDRIWKSNRGIVSPHRYFFPNYSRGIKKKKISDHDIYLIISGGITKVHEVAPKAFHFLDKLYGPEATYIDLKK